MMTICGYFLNMEQQQKSMTCFFTDYNHAQFWNGYDIAVITLPKPLQLSTSGDVVMAYLPSQVSCKLN